MTVTEDAPTEAPGKEAHVARRVLGGVAFGVLAAAAGIAIWLLVASVADADIMGLLAIPIGAGIGLAVAYGAQSRSRVVVPLVAVVITILMGMVADNFNQRSELLSGIDDLQAQWSDLQVEPVALAGPDPAPDEATATGPDGATPMTVAPECPEQADLIPPPEIVKVLPLEAYGCMPAETMAVIYPDIPTEILPQIPVQLREQAEAIIDADAAAAEAEAVAAEAENRTAQAQSDLEAARAAFTETDYDIPRPVLECAPPPDFTQPTAQAGLGFPNGVPIFLPLGDLFSEGLERGDGQTYEAPSPVCFGIENSKDHPIQAASWGIGAVLAGALAFRQRRRNGETIAEPSPPVSA